MRMALGFVIALASCNTKDKPEKVVELVPEKPVVADAAVPADAALASCLPADATIGDVKIGPDAVTYCTTEARTCWKVDLAAGTVAAIPTTPALPATDSPPAATVSPDGSVKLCPPSTKPSCTEVHPKPPFKDGDVAVSDDGKLLAHQESSGTAIGLYDGATGKRIVTLKGWKTDMGDPSPLDLPTFAGDDRLIVWGHASPVSDGGRIYTRAGKLIGPVALPDFTQNTVDTWPVDGSQWAFKQLDAPLLIVVDLATAKRVMKFELAPLTRAGDYAAAAGFAAHGDTLVYVTEAGRVGVLDRKTGAVKAIIPPACKAP